MSARAHAPAIATAIVIIIGTVAAMGASAGCKFPYPPDVPDDDVVVDDGGPVDAAAVDASTDASTPFDASVDASVDARLPLVTNFQAADLVIGQPDFVSTDPVPLDARRLFFSNAVAVTSSSLWSLDLQGRALQFSPLPATNYPSAVLVVGTQVFTATPMPTTVNAVEFSFTASCGLAATASRLLISDGSRNRVLVWNTLPATNGAAATFALGQTNLTSMIEGNTAMRLKNPGGLWTDGTHLVVADSGNHRVLIWNQFPTNGQVAADVVIGQPGFGTGGAPAVASASRLKGPTCVYSDGQRLVVADAGHRRVLIWNAFPTANGSPADIVVGQPNFVGSQPGTQANRMDTPAGMGVAGGALFVADNPNNRVLVYDPVPAANGASASFVLGQADPDVVVPTTTSASTLSYPVGVAVRGRYLYVGDSNHHRVLRFALARE